MEKITIGEELDISISVVSHAQIDLVANLLDDIVQHCSDLKFELLLTLNLNESLPFDPDCFFFPVKIIRNPTPIGFAANHNQAFAFGSGRFFCVMNPDIRLDSNPFHALMACFEDPSVGAAAPLVLGENGEIEDSARHFPGPLKILCKAMGGCKGSDYAVQNAVIHPDWAGGMCLLFPRNIFGRLGGFDNRYFLYYEDVDICARLRMLGYKVALNPKARVIHHAHRSSHRNLKYMSWHLRSMLRFFLSPGYRQCRK